MSLIYSELNKNAKSWWWHLELRKQNKHNEARQLERKSILSKTKSLRHAWLLTIGDYGTTLYCYNPEESFAKNWQLSGIEPDLYEHFCERLNIPVVDKRRISLESKMQVLRTSGPEREKLESYLRAMRKIRGVKVYTNEIS